MPNSKAANLDVLQRGEIDRAAVIPDEDAGADLLQDLVGGVGADVDALGGTGLILNRRRQTLCARRDGAVDDELLVDAGERGADEHGHFDLVGDRHEADQQQVHVPVSAFRIDRIDGDCRGAIEECRARN